MKLNGNLLLVITFALVILSSSCTKEVDNNREPIVQKYPEDLYVNVGDTDDTHCFSIKAIDPNGDQLTYQWYNYLGENLENSGSPISGETNPIFIPNKSVIDTFLYFVSVNDGQIGEATEVVKLIVLGPHVNIDSLNNAMAIRKE